MTEIETRLLLDEDITPKGKPLTHSLMVKDHYAALRYVLQQAEGKRPITVGLERETLAQVEVIFLTKIRSFLTPLNWLKDYLQTKSNRPPKKVKGLDSLCFFKPLYRSRRLHLSVHEMDPEHRLL